MAIAVDNITSTGTKMERKLSILINSKLGGETVVFFTEAAEIRYVMSNGKTPFKQFEGQLANVTNGKLVATGEKWYWGLDPKFASPKFPFGTIYKEGSTNGKDGTPKVFLTLKGKVPFVPYDIAKAVQAAFTKGEGVLTPEQVEQLRGSVSAKLAPKTSDINMPQITAEDEKAVSEDLATLESDMGSAIDRLQAGDTSLFVELGFPQVYAERWAEQIRNGSVTINSVEDVVNIRGIGKVRAEQLISAWGEKFE